MTRGLALWAPLALLLAPALASGQPSYPPGTRVEVDGIWERTYVRCLKVTREEPDEFPEIKGIPTQIDVEAGLIVIPPLTIEVPEDTDIEDDEDDEDYDFDELELRWRLKIEVEPLGPLRFRAVQIDVDRNPDENVLEIEAFVESQRINQEGDRVITLLGVECEITAATELPEGVFRKIRRREIDPDSRRPEDQITVLDGRVTFGGEIQFDYVEEDNFDLQDEKRGDIQEMDYSAVLEVLVDFGPNAFAFTRVGTEYENIVDSQDRDKDDDETTKLLDFYLFLERLPYEPLSFQVGRQRFEDEREWIYDEFLDAARAYVDYGDLSLEYSWSTFLTDAPRESDEKWYQILFLRWNHARKSYLGAYMVDIQDESDRDDSPFFLGARAIGRIQRSIRYSFDYVYVDGVDGTQEIEAHGLDSLVAYQFGRLPLKPYLFVGYAWGSGERNPSSGRTSRTFRQTGLQDNNARVFGVASYRYYGELLRPELSNLEIFTAGLGFQPVEWASVDFLYHEYRQDVAVADLCETNLRATPNRLDKDLGREFDLVFGLDKLWGHVDVELDLGYFQPGDAFDAPNDDSAYWINLQLEYNF